MNIAVTGATGLVGSHLVYHLSQKGYSVTALVRCKDKASTKFSCRGALPAPVVTVEANVLDKEDLEKALAGADVVVHAAGIVDPYGSRELIFKTNVEGTANVLAVAKKLKVQQFVFISSLSVITGFKDQFNVGEEAAVQKCGEAYADSKVEAETLVISEATKADIAVTVLRPGFIYGPGEHSWLPRLIDSISKGKAMLIDGGKRETNVIYIDNLTSATEAVLLNKIAYGQIYNLTDGQHITKKQLFDAISAGLNLPRVKKVVPYEIARSFCLLVSSFAPILPIDQQKKLARYSKAAFRLAGLNQGFSIAKAERDLNYGKRVSFDEGMAKTLSSFRSTSGISQLSVSAGASK